MFNWKFLLITCTLYGAAWTLSPEPLVSYFHSEDLSESQTLSSEEAATVPGPKWQPTQPICQEESEVTPPESDVVYLPQEIPGIVISPVRVPQTSDVCAAPNDRGLKELLREANSLLPHDKIKAIVRNALKDAEVQKIKELVTSSQFRAKVVELVGTQHFIILRDYICRALYLDVKYYVEFIRGLIAIEKAKPSSETDSIKNGRGGVQSLIRDLLAVLPKQKLNDLYERQLNTDEYLATAVGRMKSVEFRQLVRNVATLNEFLELKETLIDAGLPLQDVKSLIDVALGWYGDEFSAEDFGTNI